MRRRAFLTTALSGTAYMVVSGPIFAAMPGFEITRSDTEWRKRLTRDEYLVMRKGGTEDPYSSPLDKNFSNGTYHCKGCDLPVYSSATKFDSGTGWPSFWKPLKNAVGTMDDHRILRTLTEVHCRRCGSHLGHIFDDGPKPTGKRHCLNGISLVFRAA